MSVLVNYFSLRLNKDIMTLRVFTWKQEMIFFFIQYNRQTRVEHQVVPRDAQLNIYRLVS